MLIVKVKICGITSLEDAQAAVDMGAEMLGFNFYRKSPRYIDPDKAKDVINKLAGFIDIVGVFVNSSYDEIHDITEKCGLNWVQMHGDETSEFCNRVGQLNVKTMKAIRVKDASDIDKAKEYFTNAVLLDAFSPEKYGGTGIAFDWNIVGNIQKRIFLAGGITCDNAVEAVNLGVYGIDICSGIESQSGKKDHKKMQKLFDNIKHLRG